MIYITSDLHLNHDKEFIYEKRGFSSVTEMNEAIVDRWNSTVNMNDEVYILGDILMGDIDEALSYFDKLQAKTIYICIGNHDTRSKQIALETWLNHHLSLEKSVFIVGYADVLKYKKRSFYLSHYPTIVDNFAEDYRVCNRINMINLFGHTHSKELFYNGNIAMYNVAMDAHNMFPVSLDQIIEDIKAEQERRRLNVKQ